MIWRLRLILLRDCAPGAASLVYAVGENEAYDEAEQKTYDAEKDVVLVHKKPITGGRGSRQD